MDAYQPGTGDRDKWVPGAEMVSAEFSKGPCLKIVRWKGIEKDTPNELLASTLVNTHGCALHIQKKIFFPKQVRVILELSDKDRSNIAHKPLSLMSAWKFSFISPVI